MDWISNLSAYNGCNKSFRVQTGFYNLPAMLKYKSDGVSFTRVDKFSDNILRIPLRILKLGYKQDLLRSSIYKLIIDMTVYIVIDQFQY